MELLELLQHRPEQRFGHFGIPFPVGVLQIFAGTGLGIAEHRSGILFFAIAAAMFAVSLIGYGLVWDRQNA